ncbi:hypothetical protein Pla22_04510 [Rubripirellula amarantea]|uniref:Prepilin-type N-terminal cleavage/methylation domain-containing protein n=1 Tax=Rubripirellula amarantea TaxID=2527999 RepID=A0A5C5WRW2_9BACT|nr:hypothetical protein [Rubripirellula amarantea]TWT52823.1 hypothetical protein Pla22_04510 [Rubripirellula amarantea]
MSISRHPNIPIRKGISLIEVIACTAILAIMMVPLASLMRSSRMSLARSQSISVVDQLQDTSRWIRQAVSDGTLVDAQSDAIKLVMASGQTVKVYRQNRDLVLDDGREQVILLEEIEDVAFGDIRQSSSPGKLIGLKMQIRKRDAASGKTEETTTIVSIEPQLS